MGLNNDHEEIVDEVLRDLYLGDLTYILVDIGNLATKFFNGQRFGKYKVSVIERKKDDEIYKIETFDKYYSIEIDEHDVVISDNFETVDEIREFFKGFVEICNTHLGKDSHRKVDV